MRTPIWSALIILVLLAGCSRVPDVSTGDASTPVSPASVEISVGATVAADDPDLPRIDSAGNTPQDVLLAYIRARNRSDWETVYSLTASPTGDYASFARQNTESEVPWDDFEMYETRIVAPGKALVRVSYSTIGFSALEGQSSEESRRVVVVRAPGEWWVLEKGGSDDAVWKVTNKSPSD